MKYSYTNENKHFEKDSRILISVFIIWGKYKEMILKTLFKASKNKTDKFECRKAPEIIHNI
jgi:hypothetical protein